MGSHVLNQRMTRRSLLANAGAGALGAAAFAAVPAVTSASVQRLAPQKAGGTVTVGQVGDILNLDPFVLSAVNFCIEENAYDQLLRLDHKIAAHPWLAESYKVSDDGLKITVQLRQGVKYHSGQTMTAKDVVANFERAANKATGGNLLGNMTSVKTVSAPTPTTVEIDFSKPAAYFIDALGLQSVIEPSGFAKLKSQEAGTGAFKVKDWVPGDHLTLVKNTDYWQPQRPLLDGATIKFFSDTGSMVSALAGGILDIALAFPPNEYARFKDQFKFDPGQDGAEFYYLGLSAKVKPFDNKLVRQAMAYAVDRETMVKNVLFGQGAAIISPFPKFSPAYFPEFDKMYSFDLNKAKALLTQAGYPNGITFTIPAPSGFPELGQFAQILQADLAKIGSKVNIEPMDNAQWYPILIGGTYQATFSFAGGSQLYPTRIALSRNFAGTNNVAWPGGNPPAAYAQALADADATFDPAKQKAALKRMVTAFMDEAWNIPISFRTSLFAYTNKIHGLDWGVYNQLRLDQVTKG